MGVTHSQSNTKPSNVLAEDENKAKTMKKCADGQVKSFKNNGGVDKLDQAVINYQSSLVLYPANHPHRSMAFNSLANALETRFDQLGRMVDLDQAILNYQDALALHSTSQPNHSRYLSNLATALETRFEQLGGIADLDQAIVHYQGALASCPSGHSFHASHFSNLAGALETSFEQSAKMEDLDQAILHRHDALALCPAGHCDHAMFLDSLAEALHMRYKQLGKIADLDQAMAYHQDALALHPPGHSLHSSSLNNLAGVLETQFEQLGKKEDLDQAILYHQSALALCPSSHCDYSMFLGSLGSALHTRFEQLGIMADLDQAMVYLQDALASALDPPGQSHHSSSLHKLACALITRFEKLGKRADLDQAILHHQAALALHPVGHPDRSMSLYSLANALDIQFEQSGKMEDLEQAILHHQDAVALCPAGHSLHCSSLDSLACALQIRFDQLGNMADLNQAISSHQDALALTLLPAGHFDHSVSLSNLASALQTRFEQLGQMADLDQAISHHQDALAMHAPGHHFHSSSLNNLAGALRARFSKLGKMADLDQAILHHQDALALKPVGHPDRSSSLHNLACALITRYEKLGKIADLDQAVLHHQDALLLCPPGHIYHCISLNYLAKALQARFQELGIMEDLVQALHHTTHSLQALHKDHPMVTSTKWSFAKSLLLQHSHLQPSDDSLKVQAFVLFKEAVNHLSSGVMRRFQCASQWAHQAYIYHDSSALIAHSQALTLLHTCLVTRSSVRSQHQFLVSHASRIQTLALNAAACAIAKGQPEYAIELLEQGRSTLFSTIQGYRNSVVELQHVDALLAEQFVAVGNELEHLALSHEKDIFSSGTHNPNAIDKRTQRHHELSDKWDVLIEQIRQKENFTDFLQAVPFSTLQKSATEGPVIVVNISQYQSDAIILHAGDSPVLVSLPMATFAMLQLLSAEFNDIIQSNTPSSTRIIKVLRVLWKSFVSDVVDQLSLLGVCERSHIWWCPTSSLCGLPLHAAGPFAKGQRNLPDLYISSYTSTLSALIKGRSEIHDGATVQSIPQLLVIGQPDPTIPRVQEEVENVRRYFSNSKVLLGEQANRHSIFTYLPQYSWAHFACHGHVNKKEPFDSSFQLNNNTQLTLLELMQARLPNAEFAFLSACHSAAGNLEGTPDEVIHLASAMQFCGFKSVIGTLWAMVDLDGPDVAQDFYNHMFQGGIGNIRNAAAALNHATREMRKKNVSIDRWINFVHIGI